MRAVGGDRRVFLSVASPSSIQQLIRVFLLAVAQVFDDLLQIVVVLGDAGLAVPPQLPHQSRDAQVVLAALPLPPMCIDWSHPVRRLPQKPKNSALSNDLWVEAFSESYLGRTARGRRGPDFSSGLALQQ